MRAQFFAIGFGERPSGLVVDAQDLLSNGVSPTSEEARFGGSSPALGANDAGGIDVAVAESVDETIAGIIIADRGNGDNLGAERGEIVGGIGATAGNDLRFAMAEDQNGSFARDAGDFAVLEDVGDKIAEEEDRARRESAPRCRPGRPGRRRSSGRIVFLCASFRSL